MPIASNIVDERLETFKRACVERGVKITHQRLEIYRELASSEEHPDADTVYQHVRTRIPTVSRDTVYRNLKMLSQHGLVSIVGMSHERLRFDANMGAHHHFVCVRCGLIRDFCSPHIGSIEFPKEAETFGEPISLHLEVKGVCAACKSNAKNSFLDTSTFRG